MAIQVRVYTGNGDMQLQNLMKIAVMCDVCQVCGIGIELINDQIGSPHGSITDNGARDISHGSFLFLVEGGLWVLGQGLRGQVKAGILLTVKVIGVDIPYVKQQCHPP